MNKQYFVTGIGTGVGKTLISLYLCKYLQASYWKPIQSGDLTDSDSIFIGSNCDVKIYNEKFRLNTPASPHYSAMIDGVKIDSTQFDLPTENESLIVEGAGGILVPINNSETMLDIIKRLQIPVILVASEYLGAINHTLMSIEILKQHKIEIAGLVWNNFEQNQMIDFIESYSKVNILAKIPPMSDLDKLNFKPQFNF